MDKWMIYKKTDDFRVAAPKSVLDVVEMKMESLRWEKVVCLQRPIRFRMRIMRLLLWMSRSRYWKTGADGLIPIPHRLRLHLITRIRTWQRCVRRCCLKQSMPARMWRETEKQVRCDKWSQEKESEELLCTK